MAMSEMKQKLLLYELAKVGFKEAEYIPESDQIRFYPSENRPSFINTEGDIHYGTEHHNFIITTIRPIVDGVNEVTAAWERANPVPFENLSQFRVLADYGNAMLAARDDTERGRGLHFVTWRYDYDRTGLEHGHYTEDYASAKESFAKRAGLIPEEKIITQEQAAEIKTVIENLFENDYDLYLTYEKTDRLNAIIKQLSDAYPEIKTKDSAEHDVDIQAGFQPVTVEKSAETDGGIKNAAEEKAAVSMTVQEILYEKMKEEQKQYIGELISQSPDKIIEKVYELAIRDELVECALNTTEREAEALLTLKNPLEELYDEWLHCDTSINSMLNDCIDMKVQSILEPLNDLEAAQAIDVNDRSETIITAEALNGEIKPGDWAIATLRSDYRSLIGTVTSIDGDDVQVDFSAFDYPDWRKSEIEELFENITGEYQELDELPLNNITVPLKMLININHMDFDEIERMGNHRENCEAFCESFTGGGELPENPKQIMLNERIDGNLSDYHNTLMGFGKQEIIDMAGKISAMSEAHDYLTNWHGFRDGDSELDFYLQFQNPLEVVADAWSLRNEDIDDMSFVLDDLYNKQDALVDYPLMNDIETPSDPEMDKPPESRAPEKSDKPAEKPKTLAEKMEAAKEKAKAQDAQNSDKKPKKRDERD